MGKNNNSNNSSSTNNVVGFLAFASILIYAVTKILAKIDVSLGSLPWLGDLFLLIAVFLSAWTFVRGKKKGWKITYLVLFILAALGFVFGVGWL